MLFLIKRAVINQLAEVLQASYVILRPDAWASAGLRLKHCSWSWSNIEQALHLYLHIYPVSRRTRCLVQRGALVYRMRLSALNLPACFFLVRTASSHTYRKCFKLWEFSSIWFMLFSNCCYATATIGSHCKRKLSPKKNSITPRVRGPGETEPVLATEFEPTRLRSPVCI